MKCLEASSSGMKTVHRGLIDVRPLETGTAIEGMSSTMTEKTKSLDDWRG
jgi:hypothetical protein